SFAGRGLPTRTFRWGAPTWPPMPPDLRRDRAGGSIVSATPPRPRKRPDLRLDRAGGSIASAALARLLEDGLELELAADRRVGLHHLEAGHRVVVDVTVFVEAPLAVDAVEVLRGRDGFAHGLAFLGDVLRPLQLRRRPADRVDDHPAALGRVQGVRGRLLPELRLVGLVGLCPDAPHLLERKTGVGRN